jgi:cation diffusion facilitator family transporter
MLRRRRKGNALASPEGTAGHSGRGHMHGVADREVLASDRGIWATKVSLAILTATALAQVGVVVITGSAALLADTVHNLGDAATAVPLWVAFTLARRPPSRRFSYGLGRVEDLAGLLIVFVILVSGVVAGYESIRRLSDPPEIQFLWALMAAAVVGFAGNEGVAWFRIRVGREIGSAALEADGQHSRADGLTSLAVLLGGVGLWLGYPLADPIVGLVITAVIMFIVVQTAKPVFTRLLDGAEPEVLDEVLSVSAGTDGVRGVSGERVRWLGHRLVAEVTVAVDPRISVSDGHHIAQDVDHNLMHRLPYLSNATVHVYPETASGEDLHPHSGRQDDHQDDHDEGEGREDDHDKGEGHEHGRQGVHQDDHDKGEGHEHGRQGVHQDDHDKGEGHEHGRQDDRGEGEGHEHGR